MASMQIHWLHSSGCLRIQSQVLMFNTTLFDVADICIIKAMYFIHGKFGRLLVWSGP
jgi:hypothetical protein